MALDGWCACANPSYWKSGSPLHGLGCGIHFLLPEEGFILPGWHKGLLLSQHSADDTATATFADVYTFVSFDLL